MARYGKHALEVPLLSKERSGPDTTGQYADGLEQSLLYFLYNMKEDNQIVLASVNPNNSLIVQLIPNVRFHHSRQLSAASNSA